MACNCPEPLDCCQDCPQPPAPVLPRCNIALPDGVFTNATVVIESGCITNVSTGRPPQYTPSTCCDGGGGNGGTPGTPGEPGRDGRDGESATIAVGQVTTLPPGQPGRVVNVGSPATAILDFYLPVGELDEGELPSIGLDDSSAGIVFEDGLLKQIPGTWPPALAFVSSGAPDGVELNFSQPDQHTGVVAVDVDISEFLLNVRQWVNDRLDDELEPILNRLDAAETEILDLKTKTNAMTTRIEALESKVR